MVWLARKYAYTNVMQSLHPWEGGCNSARTRHITTETCFDLAIKNNYNWWVVDLHSFEVCLAQQFVSLVPIFFSYSNIFDDFQLWMIKYKGRMNIRKKGQKHKKKCKIHNCARLTWRVYFTMGMTSSKFTVHNNWIDWHRSMD